MEALESRIMEKLAELTQQVGGLTEVKETLTGLGSQFEQQLQRIDQLQVKVDLSMNSLGAVQKDHEELAKSLKAQPPPPVQILARESAGIMGPPPNGARPPTPHGARPGATPYANASSSPILDPDDSGDPGGSRQKRQWIPKMDYPKFDGTKPVVWIDQCNDYFTLYQIPEGFKVTAASMNMIGDAALWLQSFKKNVHHHRLGLSLRSCVRGI